VLTCSQVIRRLPGRLAYAGGGAAALALDALLHWAPFAVTAAAQPAAGATPAATITTAALLVLYLALVDLRRVYGVVRPGPAAAKALLLAAGLAGCAVCWGVRAARSRPPPAETDRFRGHA
jgi:hypothetical protein